MMKYTKIHLDFLRQHETMPRKELTKIFNAKFEQKRTLSSIAQKCRKIGLVCPNNGCFPKGHIPANKDTKGLMKSNKTSFKKHYIPQNIKTVGSITTRKDKNGHTYMFIKIAEPNKWQMLHIYVWELLHGKVPKGHCVIFKDKNTLNPSPDNLMLVSRDELVRLNQKYTHIDGSLKETALQVIQIQKKLKDTQCKNKNT